MRLLCILKRPPNSSMKNHCLTVLATIACFSAFAQQRTLLHCGNLLDGIGNSVQPQMTVVVEGNKITALQRGYTTPAGSDLVIIGPKIQATFAKAYKAGVKVAFGTDAGVYPHGLNAKEFEFMVEGGMPPIEAIRAATMVNAELLGMKNQLGSVETGKFADLIAVDENPLLNIKTLQAVRFVMKEGKVYKQ